MPHSASAVEHRLTAHTTHTVQITTQTLCTAHLHTKHSLNSHTVQPHVQAQQGVLTSRQPP